MKVAIMGADSFIGMNLVENLKNLRDGKNRTRPKLSISDIYLDEIKDADVVVFLQGSSALDEYSKEKKYIYVSTLGAIDETILPKGAILYLVPEIVGKWQKPESGIAYLCHAIANDEKYEIENPHETIEVLFVDDLIEEMFDALEGHPHRCDYQMVGSMSSDWTAQYDGRLAIPNEAGKYCYSPNVCRTTIGNVENHLIEINSMNKTSLIPEMPSNSIAKKLYSMYLSFLPEKKMSYPLKMSVDNRGVFTELFKTKKNGQMSINIARPGNVRGQHWHNNKWEIFIVVSGHGLIQERKIGTNKVINFEVRGEEMKAIIMLPGYTHNIINLEKDRDLVTVMFANEPFDPNYPDTFFEVVDDYIV